MTTIFVMVIILAATAVICLWLTRGEHVVVSELRVIDKHLHSVVLTPSYQKVIFVGEGDRVVIDGVWFYQHGYVDGVFTVSDVPLDAGTVIAIVEAE